MQWLNILRLVYERTQWRLPWQPTTGHSIDVPLARKGGSVGDWLGMQKKSLSG